MQVPRRRNWGLLFGKPKGATRSSDRTGASFCLFDFHPGDVWGLSRQTLNDFGVTYWEVLVLRAVKPGAAYCAIPGVRPGAEVLFHVYGTEAAKRALRFFELLEELELRPQDHPELIGAVGLKLVARVFPERQVRDYAASWRASR